MGISASEALPVNRMTHMCQNITLPRTLFTGGNDSSLMRIPEIMLDKTLQMSLSFSSMTLAQADVLLALCPCFP